MIKKNYSFYKKNNQRLYNILKSDSMPKKIHLQESEDGCNYIMYNNNARCFMHSIYSIKEEMNMMFKNVTEETDTIILYGSGHGHALDYIIENYPNVRYLLVIEPSAEIFKKLAENYDLSRVYNKIKYVRILVQHPTNILTQYIKDALTKSKKVSLVNHISYLTIFSNEHDETMKYVIEQIKFLRDGFVLAKTSIYPWLINGIKNLKKQSIPVEDIIEVFKDKPVILVGAGPSLNKNIHLLKKAKNKALIIAGGSAVKILDSHNITPHFRIAIDGLKREKKILDGIDGNDVPLLLTNNLYYEIAEEYKGPLIRFINGAEYLGKYIYKKEDISYITMDSGTSVINSALSLVCQGKCKEVIFIGQDLSYLEGERYAKGSNFSHLKYKFNSHAYKKMKDTSGNDVYTTDSMLTMKYSFESIIRKFPDIHFINATEGGLPIEGTEVKALTETIKEISSEHNININRFMEDKVPNKEYMAKINNALKYMKEEVEEVLAINNQIYKLIKETENRINNGTGPKEILMELKNLESFNEKLKNNSFYDQVLVNSLKTLFKTAIVNFEYNGTDMDKKVKSIIKISMIRVVEAQKYATLALKMLND
ncbi:MAG: motility associated factor glycosyltransferase family protein [Clostridiaceae bacterium]|nr:motility associated factor glycosyltransferase family protein [Clostridiaceae bacterium]